VSRDDGALETELGLQGQRALLAALQASNLPKDIADIINSLVAESASSQDIQRVLAAAVDMKTVLDHIGDINLKGLNVAAVQAWQQSGETLSQTLARIGGAIASFDNSFMSDAQKLTVAQQQVNAVFAQFGQVVPPSTAAFYELVHSIDVSTEEGRKWLEALLGVSNAFLLTVQATDSTTTSANNAATAVQNFGDSMGDVANSIHYYDQSKLEDLKKYIDSLLTNNQLSPLSPTDQLATARKQYEDLLAKANTGDTTAIGALSGASDTYLRIAREIFASSSAYVDIFNSVMGQLTGLTGYDLDWQTKLTSVLPASSPIVSQADLRDAVRRIVSALGGVAAANDDAVDAQTRALASAVRADPARR
jgi:hypothetical protein